MRPCVTPTSDTPCVCGIALNLPHSPVKQARCHSCSPVGKQKLPRGTERPRPLAAPRLGRIPSRAAGRRCHTISRGRLGQASASGVGTGHPVAGRVWGTGETLLLPLLPPFQAAHLSAPSYPAPRRLPGKLGAWTGVQTRLLSTRPLQWAVSQGRVRC